MSETDVRRERRSSSPFLPTTSSADNTVSGCIIFVMSSLSAVSTTESASTFSTCTSDVNAIGIGICIAFVVVASTSGVGEGGGGGGTGDSFVNSTEPPLRRLVLMHFLP